ncbi:hypothetical protein M408DRAFT_334343 [Serendipita vermifera MAFF 305830]|uniref:Uncharacterized protein n=1 Tax=Serendipita vermifera MAFF 305830 TaxID=933852 RepID=A0A0C3A4H7_SERVB|nr:hypothetical protein M408DRAFT_334343 [Serendipita vermifera MAFF 305830]
MRTSSPYPESESIRIPNGHNAGTHANNDSDDPSRERAHFANCRRGSIVWTSRDTVKVATGNSTRTPSKIPSCRLRTHRSRVESSARGQVTCEATRRRRDS